MKQVSGRNRCDEFEQSMKSHKTNRTITNCVMCVINDKWVKVNVKRYHSYNDSAFEG